MNFDRWSQLDSLLQLVLEQGPEERDEFLKRACDGDETLERELRSLLTLEREAGNFLEHPAIEVVARDFARRNSESGESLIGRIFSHYCIVEKLGDGGMGVVFKAEDTRLHRFVALKFLSDELASDPEALNRFRREARAASALSHPNICTIYDIGEEDGRAFIVMEHLEGGTLKQRLANGRIPMEELIALGVQITSGLDAAHKSGIVHRDIKPANIFIAQPNHVKILDFGLAQLGAEEPITQPGVAVGTTAYMSPEQARGEALDSRTDLFSFGLVLWEMYTGTRPLPGVQVGAEVPTGLERIISKCLASDRDLRYRSASEIRSDLQALAGAKSSHRWNMIVPAGLAVAAALVVGYFSLYRTRSFTDKDTIVLADFRNTTGDPVFDGTLRQGLAVQLEQSPFLSLVSDERIQKTMGLMGQPPDARLTPEVSREVCERIASAAVLEGSITSLGSQYVLGLRARSCRNGEILDDQQTQVARKEDVLTALSQLASRFRSRAGESLSTIEKHSTPLAEATTSSLDALKAYSTALKIHVSTGSSEAAVPLFRRAVEIDPKFAMAYAWLGRMYGDSEDPALSTENTRRAWQLRDRISDKEKLFIDLSYNLQVSGNLERVLQTYELWQETYPRDRIPRNGLSGMVYAVAGKFEKAVDEDNKLIQLEPDEGPGYLYLSSAYICLDRLEEAEAAMKQAEERKVDLQDLQVQRFDVAFLKGDRAGMEREVTLSRDKSDAEAKIASHQAFALAYWGELRQSRKMSRHAIELARQSGQFEKAALYETGAALSEAFLGNASDAKRSANAALQLSKELYVEYGCALALALSGDFIRAESLADDLNLRFPEDTSARFSYLPALRAALALNRAEPEQAVDLLRISIPSELGTPRSAIHGFFGAMYPIYMRGEAFLALHRGTEAVAEFQKIVDHPGLVVSDPVGASTRLQLARAWVLAGDKAKARTAYRIFLTLWKDADPDTLIFKQAREELAKLP